MKSLRIRLVRAAKPALQHLLVCMTIALGIALLVFGLWYPTPFDQVSNGRRIFVLLLGVDVIVGPLLTLIIFDVRKSKKELVRDLLVIFSVQLLALSYGLFNLMQARPVWLAFEGDRFRVVSVADIDLEKMSDAPPNLRVLSLSGPKLLGVRLVGGQDPEYWKSIEMSLNGFPPSFRPKRWVTYESQIPKVIENARPLGVLYEKKPEIRKEVDEIVSKEKLKINQLGYVPLLGRGSLDWAVIVGLEDGLPKGYLALDAWD